MLNAKEAKLATDIAARNTALASLKEIEVLILKAIEGGEHKTTFHGYINQYQYLVNKLRGLGYNVVWPPSQENI